VLEVTQKFGIDPTVVPGTGRVGVDILMTDY
jgi:hypothetical protein